MTANLVSHKRGAAWREIRRTRAVGDQQGHRDPDGVRRRWRAHVDRDRQLRKPSDIDSTPAGIELVAWRLLERTEERSYRIGLAAADDRQ
jgi:hypothetical protein